MRKMESTGKFIKRKLGNIGSGIYRSLIFSFVKMRRERKHDSIIGKRAYLSKGCILGGRNYIGNDADLTHVSIGYSTYIGPGSNISNTVIGKYSCIAGLETAIGRHPVKGENVSVHPAFYSSTAQYGYTYVKDSSFEEVKFTDKERGFNISIGNDVWIGRGTMIVDGVTIGDGAVVGAGSLVLSDVEPYAIYAGTPAKKTGDRFDEDTKKKLLDLRWWDKDEAWIAEHAKEFRNPGEFIRNCCDQ